MTPTATIPEAAVELTIAEHAVRYRELKRALEPLIEMLAESEAALKDHFEATGAGSFEDMIGWQWVGGALILDQPQARELLAGAGIEVPTKTTKRSRSLTLLK